MNNKPNKNQAARSHRIDGNTPRVMPLKNKKIEVAPEKRRKNRVTVRQLISACCMPMLVNLEKPDMTKAIDEFVSMKFDYARAAQIHMTTNILQKYIDAAMAAFNGAPADKKDQVLNSSMVLHFQPFDLVGLFIGGAISAKAMAQLGGWLIKLPEVKIDLHIDPPLAEVESLDDDEEDGVLISDHINREVDEILEQDEDDDEED